MKKLIILSAIILLSNIHIMPDTFIGEYKTRGLYLTYDTGIVLDDEGNGQITTIYADDFYNYIAYDPETTKQGDKVTSLYIYNPLTTYGDDIIFRYDIRR